LDAQLRTPADAPIALERLMLRPAIMLTAIVTVGFVAGMAVHALMQ
jgi:hypothetical protein